MDPPTQPIDLSSNTDAIALRAAISILSLQREQAVRDMQTLERQKTMALADPLAFAQAVKTGDIKSRTLSSGLDFSYPGDDDDTAPNRTSKPTYDSDDSEQEDEMDVDPALVANAGPDMEKREGESTFGDLPAPQNIVRAPPVKWRQYHIVGEALDALHEAQVRDPDEGRPRTDEDVRQAALRRMAEKGELPGRGRGLIKGRGGLNEGGERVVMAPFDPFRDQVVKVRPELSGQGEGVGVDGDVGGGAKGKGKEKELGPGVGDKSRSKGKGKAKEKGGTPKRRRR